MRIGYARVSSAAQDHSTQEARRKAAGCEVVRAEKASGKSLEETAVARAVRSAAGRRLRRMGPHICWGWGVPRGGNFISAVSSISSDAATHLFMSERKAPISIDEA